MTNSIREARRLLVQAIAILDKLDDGHYTPPPPERPRSRMQDDVNEWLKNKLSDRDITGAELWVMAQIEHPRWQRPYLYNAAKALGITIVKDRPWSLDSERQPPPAETHMLDENLGIPAGKPYTPIVDLKRSPMAKLPDDELDGKLSVQEIMEELPPRLKLGMTQPQISQLVIKYVGRGFVSHHTYGEAFAAAGLEMGAEGFLVKAGTE